MAWLLALLTLGTAASVLWIVAEAMRAERFAARQRWNEAAQIRLTDARQRLDHFFSTRRVALLQLADQPPPQVFAAAVRDGIADSLICQAASGTEIYPQPFTAMAMAAAGGAPDPGSLRAGSGEKSPADWEAEARGHETTGSPATAAGAWLAAQRAWLAGYGKRSGLNGRDGQDERVPVEKSASASVPASKAAAATGLPEEFVAVLRISENFFSLPAHRLLIGPDGRRRAAAADLWALQEFRRFRRPLPAAVALRLKHDLTDYTAPAMPASQRRFLMLALAELENQPPAGVFDTFAAETLAARYHLDKTAATTLRLTENGPLLLFRPESLLTNLEEAAAAPGLTLLTEARAPEAGAVTLEIHPALPGWRLSMNRGAQDQGTRRIAFYGGLGGGFVLLLGGLTALTWRHVRRQLQRARLQHDLAATVSHELRTPVASMRLLVESLQEDPRLDESKTRDYLALVSTENHRLSQLIDNFLTLARLDKSPAAAAARHEVRGLMERAAATARAAGHGERLRVELPPDSPAVHADASMLEIALLNLIDNACKFSPPGTGVIFKAAAETGTGPSGNRVRFSITDMGPGLTPAEQARLWQPFERLARHRATHRGCGLGLAIVRRAATQAGGTVEIASIPGQGSTFSLILPAAGPAEGEFPDPDAGPGPVTESRRDHNDAGHPAAGHPVNSPAPPFSTLPSHD